MQTPKGHRKNWWKISGYLKDIPNCFFRYLKSRTRIKERIHGVERADVNGVASTDKDKEDEMSDLCLSISICEPEWTFSRDTSPRCDGHQQAT